MLVEGVAAGYAFRRFLECLVSYQEIGDEIDEEQLPGGEAALFLYDYGSDEEYGGDRYQDYLFLQSAFLMLMVMLMLVMMSVLVAAASVLMVMMFV
jgi:hypothetical protein